jgi:hypothetical protein
MLQPETVLRSLAITVFSVLTCLSFSARAETAANVTFDDSGTNLTGVNVQEAIEAIDTAVLGSVAHMRDLEFDPPVLNGDSNGLFWPLTTPSVTQFFEGVISTDEGGSLAQPNNVYCASYNFGECGPGRFDTGEHAVKWMLEATRRESPGADEYIQNRITFAADDGTTWDPWVFRVNVDQNRSSFEFNSSPTRRSFTLFETGEVRVGLEDPSTPTHQLEVMGGVRITHNLDVQGNLLVSGNITQYTDTNQMLWGDASDPAYNTGNEVCGGVALTCNGAHEPDGTSLACNASPSSGFLFALCR